jgi:hypothetical protein
VTIHASPLKRPRPPMSIISKTAAAIVDRLPFGDKAKAPAPQEPAPSIPANEDEFDSQAARDLEAGLRAAVADGSGAVITRAELDPLLAGVEGIVFSPIGYDPERASVIAVLEKYMDKMDDDASRSASWFLIAGED